MDMHWIRIKWNGILRENERKGTTEFTFIISTGEQYTSRNTVSNMYCNLWSCLERIKLKRNRSQLGQKKLSNSDSDS